MRAMPMRIARDKERTRTQARAQRGQFHAEPVPWVGHTGLALASAKPASGPADVQTAYWDPKIATTIWSVACAPAKRPNASSTGWRSIIEGPGTRIPGPQSFQRHTRGKHALSLSQVRMRKTLAVWQERRAGD